MNYYRLRLSVSTMGKLRICASSQRRLANIGHFSHIGAPFFLFESARQKREVPPMSERMRAGILILRGK